MQAPSAIMGAATGGAFMAGFLVALKADDVAIGWLTSLSQFFVVFQLAAAYLVMSEWSRKKLTISFSLLVALAWLAVAALGLFGTGLSTAAKTGIFAVLFSAVAAAGHVAGNARQSWIGELIPEDVRGRYNSICWFVGNLVAVATALGAGVVLDAVKSRGLPAFGWLFVLAGFLGIVMAYIYRRQPDCPLPGGRCEKRFARMALDTFGNRPLMRLVVVQVILALGGIAGPFWGVYQIRDVGLTYFQAGILGGIQIVGIVVGSLVCTRIISRTGCRPLIILGLATIAPLHLVWLWIPPGAPERAMWLLPATNFLSGVSLAVAWIGIGTLVYKLTDPGNRAVQFAVTSVITVLVGAPMPLLGGWLTGVMHAAWPWADLRVTFLINIPLTAAAAIWAARLREEGSASTRHIVFERVPTMLLQWVGGYVPAAARAGLPSSWLRRPRALDKVFDTQGGRAASEMSDGGTPVSRREEE